MIQVYAFFSGVPRVVGFIPSLHWREEWEALQRKYPGKDLYQGSIVERHQAIGYVEDGNGS